MSLPTRQPENTQLQRLTRTYLDELQARDPLFADSIGVHTYDDQLPDYSASALAERERWQRSWRSRFFAIDPMLMLGTGGNADRTAMLDTIDLELYEDQTIDPWRNDPGRYVQAIGSAVYSLIGRHYASVDTRLGNVALRLTLVPNLVDAAITNLQRPPRVLTQFAIDQNAGNISMYRDDILTAAKGASPGLIRTLKQRIPPAVKSLERLQRFLSTTLLPRSTGNPRVGAAVFDRELVLLAGTDVSRATLVSRARDAMDSQRNEMLRLALPLDKKFFPHAPRDYSGDELIDRVVRRVLDRLAHDHPAKNQVFQTARSDVKSLESFLTANPVVPLPQPNTLSVAPTPAFMAGFGGASLDPPGPFSPLSESYFYIDQIPASWTADHVASYLRENNNYEMKMLSIHEAVPGHYVQFRYNNELPSLVRRVFGNGSFIEGWAVWTEAMMLNAGYGNGDPRLRLFQLKWRLREEANAIIDAQFHAGSLAREQCITFLQQKAFQEHAEAENKWHRLEVSHVQLSTYYAGLEAIERARNSTQSRYDRAAFNRRLLQMGDVEPRFIHALI